ncbi:hypothetical protein BMF94_4255 [Rhodotorula taiwanensis]|uniref:Major facilitator superfamily (MFS) profile domain-containing protein n=1 Tax=Rhodotorula taiwanensis TaxID=741276 RepID=A0A2S5B6N3_9BASI|nr:hypothetical protein BMF94_4255 [Rhodotorula taiwanensis]
MSLDRDAEFLDEKAVIEHIDQIAEYGAAVDPQAEKRLLRKLDFIILPQVTLLFLLNFIDRSAVGNANVAGFSKDLKLSVPKNEYNIALMVFYVFYIAGEIPSNLILKKVGSSWLAVLAICFGVVTIGSAWIKNFGEFLAVRILLGIFEGGVIPGIVYVMTTYYKRSELAFRIGVFLSLGPGLSGAFGGLLAAGLLKHNYAGLHTWQRIFVLEGILTACVGVVTFFTLPAAPGKTRWLSEAERELAVRRLEIEHLGQTNERTSWKAVGKAIANPFTWACTLAYGFINVIVQGTSLFLPTIISGLGKYTTVETQLRSVPPYIVSAAWALLMSYFAWKTQRHGLFIAASTSLSVVGYIMFIASSNPQVLYGASFLTFTGALPCGPFFLAWATANSGNPVARAVTAAIVPAFGSWGSMVCTWLYLPAYRPRYRPGNIFNLISCCCAIGLALGLTFYCKWENRQRDLGRRDHRLEGKTEQEIKDLGWKHPSYRLKI